MKISVRVIIYGMLFVILYSGLQGGKYFYANRLQEVGILFILILFVCSSVFVALLVRERDLGWSWWVGSTIIILAYTIIIPAQRFSVNANVSIIPSLFASREFLFVMIAPTIYFLYRLGISVEDIEKIFLLVLISLVFSYLFHYKRINLELASRSMDHTLSALITYDPWRGYRLKQPTSAFILMTVLTPLSIFASNTFAKKSLWVIILLFLAYGWSLILSRVQFSTIFISVSIYVLFFSKKNKLGLFFFFVPLIMVISYLLTIGAIDHLSKLDPETDGVRYKSGAIALKSFLNTPLFGFGQSSNHTLTEQDIFWNKFHATDLGILGILFKYGVVGGICYLAFVIFFSCRIISTNWMHSNKFKKLNNVLSCISVYAILYAILIILVPIYVTASGITTGAFGVALAAIWRHKLRNL